MKVILIGNGSSVLDNEMGEYIDSEFDLVYRINRFKTKGFESCVGSRVDGWFLADTGIQWLKNPTDKVEGSLRYTEFEYVFICMPKFKFTTQLNFATDTIQLLSYDYEDQINSVIDLNPQWPSTGLITIQFLVENYEKIYIHGFDGMNKKYKFTHYYDNGDSDRLTEKWTSNQRIDHDFKKESEYINFLRKDKKVIDIV